MSLSVNWTELILRLILILPIILISLSAHEFAHGYISSRLGDPTPARNGRLTFNPMAHLDPFGTLILIATSLFGFGAFGWAKPVPINPRYYRNPIQGLFLVALAGPLTNLSLAAVFGFFFRLAYAAPTLQYLLALGVIINLGLCLFNLIPIPPLDGSRAILYFLRGRAYEVYMQMQQYGIIFLVVLFFSFRFFGNLIYLPVQYLFYLLTGSRLVV